MIQVILDTRTKFDERFSNLLIFDIIFPLIYTHSKDSFITASVIYEVSMGSLILVSVR